MKPKVLIPVLLVICLILGITSYAVTRSDNGTSREDSSDMSPSPAPTSRPSFSQSNTTYFTAVAGQKNKLNTISLEQLQQTDPILVLETSQELVKSLQGFNSAHFKSITSLEEMVNVLNKSTKELGILAIEDATFKVKTLEVDNQYIYDRTLNLAEYPLQVTQEVTISTDKPDTSNLEQSKLTRLGHTGSMIPARGVTRWINEKWAGDYTHLFKSTKPLFDTMDYTSATFECSILGRGRQCSTCMSFLGPDEFMEGVTYSGIDLFSLAANHILDGGVEAIANTQQKLEEAGIQHTGASTRNNDDAAQPVLVEVNGLKIAYLGFNDTPGRAQWAMESKPGAASISDWDLNANGATTRYEPNEERIKFFLQRAKDLNPDKIFVIMHWGGQEYVNQALGYQQRLGSLLLKHGADVILGDHVHWVQEIEFQGNKPIFYGVGNYIFDQMWSTETRQGMSIEMNFLGDKLVNFRLHPHELHLYTKGMPILLKENDPAYDQTLDRVWNVSNKIY
ncbi:MAG: CapA family protein [Candidatus Dojkabacteria bacterium]